MASRPHPPHLPVHRLAEPPYPPGWLDRLIDFVGRMPGSNAGWCILLALAQTAWLVGMLWATGQPLGEAGAWRRFFSVVITPGLLWARFHLDGVAAACMDRFRPMLPVGDEEFERLRYELTTLSARTTNLVTAVVVSAVIVNAFFTPKAWVKLWGGSIEVAWMVIGPLIVSTLAFVAVSLAQAMNQLRMVGRIHELVGPVDIRRAKPLHAFSRLTALTGVSYIFLASYVIAARPDLVESLPLISVIIVMALIPVGIASFLLPLRGMHERLVDAKDRAIARVEQQLATVYARVHRQVEEGSYENAQPMKLQIDSLTAELESLKKLSTWPWETTTLTGFLTTLVLPIFLWLLQRGLARSGF